MSFPQRPSQDELHSLIRKKFGCDADIDKFEDHEGDKITVENDGDLQEAFDIYYSLVASRPQLLHTLKLFLRKTSNSLHTPSPLHSPVQVSFLARGEPRLPTTTFSSSDSVATVSGENQNYLRDYHSPNGITSQAPTLKTPPVSLQEYLAGSHDSPSPTLRGPGEASTSPEFKKRVGDQVRGARARSSSNPLSATPNRGDDYVNSHWGQGPPVTSIVPILGDPVTESANARAPALLGSPFSPVTRTNTPARLDHPCMDNISWKKGQLLGCGGFGSVYLGLLETGEIIAVKQIEFTDPGGDPVLIERMEEAKREIEIMKRLQHEHIVQYLGSHIERNVISIFLE